MRGKLSAAFGADAPPPLAVVLGTNEIASAVAVHLCRAGWRVVLSHDPFPPVIRRAMAFHDALFGDQVTVEGIACELAETASEIADVITGPKRVAVTTLHVTELLALQSFDVLVDARMQKHCVTPDLRRVARTTVGLGPNFRVGANCDVAVETRPARSGNIVRLGSTEPADGVSSPLDGVGRERFVYSDRPGRWHASVDIGARVFTRFVVAHLDGSPIRAPLDGFVRGIVRDGMQVPAEVKLLEIDPRGRNAMWTGIDARGRGIAEAVVRALRAKSRQRPMPAAFAAT